ncbi:MAG: hypothetical protein FWG64_00350, partial [Firmicutes bacterium]|nr:hypothetical protein [Bacillota bacterium]
MIIYSMEHFMSFYQMLTLRLIKHKNEKAILIFSSFSDSISLKKHLFDKLKNIGVFDEIISLPFISAKTMKDENLQTEQQIMNKIISTYNPIMESHGVNLHDIKTAYEFYDWNASFAFFMYYYNINFVQLEPMPNSTEFFYHRCVDLLKKDFTTPVYFNLYEKIFRMNEHDKPTGKIMLFSETIFFDNANLTEEEKSFVEYFDFNKNFCLIDESYKQKILSCFNIDINFLKNNSVCILIPNSFHFTWIISQRSEKVIHKLKDALYTDSEYEKIYITLAEYFSHKDNIVMYISHPNYNTSTMGIDTFVNRKIYIFDKNMPVEFLHWIPNFRIKQALSVKTTATQKLTTIIDENIELDWGFVQMYNIMDRLYIIQKIISTLPQSINLHFYAITTEVFEMLYKCHFDNYLEKTFIPLKTCENVMLKNSGVCVVNTRIIEDEPISNQNFILDMLEKSQPNSIVFFTNIFNESAFVPLLLSRKFLLDFIVPIQINRTPLDDGEQVG